MHASVSQLIHMHDVGVCQILPRLRHLGDRLAASPTSYPDLTPYSGVVVSSWWSLDTWDTWDTYFNSQRVFYIIDEDL